MAESEGLFSVALSNFLYARGVEHRKGERYPAAFSECGDARYGIYDMHFKAADGEWIDVEVWGDNPKGQQPEKYARRRESKETFNRENKRFQKSNVWMEHLFQVTIVVAGFMRDS